MGDLVGRYPRSENCTPQLNDLKCDVRYGDIRKPNFEFRQYQVWTTWLAAIHARRIAHPSRITLIAMSVTGLSENRTNYRFSSLLVTNSLMPSNTSNASETLVVKNLKTPHIICPQRSCFAMRTNTRPGGFILRLNNRVGEVAQWQPGSIPALVLHSGDMAARHRKFVAAERILSLLDDTDDICEPKTEILHISEWIEFFTAAGVPAAVRKTYAQIFVDHRITGALVADLEKEHLKDMGINVIGDIIAILKQCRKVGHEDPAATIPNVTSTTTTSIAQPPSKTENKSPSTVQFSTPSSTTGTVVRRRMTPEIEGKYIVKHPAGTTAKTQRILANMRQRETLSKLHVKNTEPVTGGRIRSTPRSALTSFEESDVEDSDGYRVILSKEASRSSNLKGSVFGRLGAPTAQVEVPPQPPKQTTVIQRLVARSINTSPSVAKKPTPACESRVSSKTPTTGGTPSNLSITRQVIRAPMLNAMPMKARLASKRQHWGSKVYERTAVKLRDEDACLCLMGKKMQPCNMYGLPRVAIILDAGLAGDEVDPTPNPERVIAHEWDSDRITNNKITESVFNRLDDSMNPVSVQTAIRYQPPNSRDSLGYAGILKRPRLHPPTKTISQPSSVRSKPVPFTEGVLSSELTSKKLHNQQSVKARLELINSASPMAGPGFELCTSNMRGERVTTTPPAHAGLIRIFTSEQVDMFALVWCERNARRPERRPSNIPWLCRSIGPPVGQWLFDKTGTGVSVDSIDMTSFRKTKAWCSARSCKRVHTEADRDDHSNKSQKHYLYILTLPPATTTLYDPMAHRDEAIQASRKPMSLSVVCKVEAEVIRKENPQLRTLLLLPPIVLATIRPTSMSSGNQELTYCSRLCNTQCGYLTVFNICLLHTAAVLRMYTSKLGPPTQLDEWKPRPHSHGTRPETGDEAPKIMISANSLVVELDHERLVRLQRQDPVLRKFAAALLDGSDIKNAEEDKGLETSREQFERLSLNESGILQWSANDPDVVLLVIHRILRVSRPFSSALKSVYTYTCFKLKFPYDYITLLEFTFTSVTVEQFSSYTAILLEGVNDQVEVTVIRVQEFKLIDEFERIKKDPPQSRTADKMIEN
ncbi:hypothetical protein CLF_100343 [Clonorchis sinensis]|uniref:SAM domain-containing protein n=1 Tax=Clonorchis sinensis TaxID=79923 RepID=G7Y389_CLOSI|nr:hypothetical protein CLF_100343 [Clonorchis sinensis]